MPVMTAPVVSSIWWSLSCVKDKRTRMCFVANDTSSFYLRVSVCTCFCDEAKLLRRKGMLLCREAMFVRHKANFVCHEVNFVCHEVNFVCHEVNFVCHEVNFVCHEVNFVCHEVMLLRDSK